jgi:serine/threonine protein kinase
MDTERNLLFGVVALQSGAVDADGLSETCADWASAQTMPLADALVGRGLMTDEQRSQIEETVARELASHGDDPQATLAATIDGRSLQALGGVVAAGDMPSASPSSASASASMSALAVASLPPQPGAGQGGHVVLGRLSPGETDARERYTLTHLHAKGGMGRVWLARDGSLGRQIALKELRPDQADNSIVCSRFLYEAKITAQLEHPSIVPVYELGEGDAPYYTMRFVRGRTLSEAIRAYHKKRAAGEADSVGLNDLLMQFVSVCHAVAYAHSRGIIHRDLKGQNVVLGDFGEVIVLDWGLAKRVGPDPTQVQAQQPGAPPALVQADRMDPEPATAATCAAAPSDDGLTLPEDPDDATSAGSILNAVAGSDSGYSPGANGSHGTNGSHGSAHSAGNSGSREIPESGAGPEGTMQGQLLGTPAYMAPEQAQARHDLVDQRTDIYGLGAILYEILTGRPPFVAPKTSEVIKKVINEQPTPPRQIVPEIGPGLEAVCLKALRKAKPDRYQSASELAQEVRLFLADEPVKAFAEPWTLRAQRWVRRNRTKVVAAAAALIIATIALGVSTLVVANERNEAEAQGEQARQAVNLLARGADIAFDDQLDPIQKEMLQDALNYYEKFTGRASKDPVVRLEHGHAFQQMGDIERKLGKLDESEKAYHQAIAKLEPLAGIGGDTGRKAKQALARTRTLLGDLLVRNGKDRDKAGPLYTQALEVQRVLADAGQDPAASAVDILRLGQTYRSQGNLLRLDGAFSEARPVYDQAVAELGRALAADAGHSTARNELALALDARGLIERELGDAEAAEKDYRRSIEGLEALVAEFPTVSRHREALAGACSHLGALEQQAGRLDDAEAHLRREVALDERLAGDFPDRLECRRELARGLTTLGNVLQLAGQVAEAEPVLRRAIELNAAIADKSPDDVLFRFQLGMAHHDLGAVLIRQGNADAAIASFREAQAINEALAKKYPDKPRYRFVLAGNLSRLAMALGAASQPGVDEAFRAATGLYETLVLEHPENAEYRLHQSVCLRDQGIVLADAGKPQEAEAVLGKALALLDARSPKDRTADWQRKQAEVLNNLGQLRREGAEDALRRSIAISAGLAEGQGKAATAIDDRHTLAVAEFNLAELLIERKRPADAGASFDRSVAGFEKLVAAAPKVAQYHHHFGLVLAGQGSWLDQSGKTAEAKGAYTAAVEHQRQAMQLSKNAPPYRLALAGHLIALADVNRKLGAYDQAAKLALEVPKVVPSASRAEACFDAARALARLVVQLGADLKVPEKERDHLSRVYLTRTVVLIRDAVDADPKLSEPIKADPDIKVLQSRPEFQAILNTLVEAGR